MCRRLSTSLSVYALAVAVTGIGWLALAPAAHALPGPAAHISVALSQSLIPANGSSMTTATATVTDANGVPVDGESIGFTSSGAQVIGPTSAVGGGTGMYTATITSSMAPGQFIITAQDPAPPLPPLIQGAATLTQYGTAAAITMLSVTPSTIPANGFSTSVATARVTDSSSGGNPVPGETVVINGLPATDNGDGTYSATITSSTTPQTTQISAIDGALSTPNPLPLNEGGSLTNLARYPSTAITNTPVTLIASVAGTFGGAPSGTVTFYNAGVPISGCSGVALTPYATCQTTFSAASSPVQLSATFTPDSTSTAAGSTGTATLSVGLGSTSTSLDLSTPAASVGGSVTYTASVAANGQGPFGPNGSVRFLDGGSPIGSCGSVHLVSMFGVLVASCTVHYSVHGNHSVVAVYGGDRNFAGSQSNTVQLAVLRQSPGTPRLVTSAMEWSFYFTPTFTQFRSLILIGASVGTHVVMACNGKGCPFAKLTSSVARGIRCTPGGKHRCGSSRGPINLTPMFHKHRLRVGTRITIEIVRAGWIGKFYAFVFRPSLPPKVRISCLAPGRSRPGVGC